MLGLSLRCLHEDLLEKFKWEQGGGPRNVKEQEKVAAVSVRSGPTPGTKCKSEE